MCCEIAGRMWPWFSRREAGHVCDCAYACTTTHRPLPTSKACSFFFLCSLFLPPTARSATFILACCTVFVDGLHRALPSQGPDLTVDGAAQLLHHLAVVRVAVHLSQFAEVTPSTLPMCLCTTVLTILSLFCSSIVLSMGSVSSLYSSSLLL